MERKKVESSNLESIGYDPASRVLEVEFKGGSVYRYRECTADQFRGLQDAVSKGSYFSKNIRGVLKFEKVQANEVT